MNPIAHYRQLRAHGMDEETAAALAEQFCADRDAEIKALYDGILATLASAKDEAAERRRERDRERKRTVRGIPQTSADTRPETKVPPAPPSKTQTQDPPYSPPAKPKRAARTGAISPLAEELWAFQPEQYRRSTRPDVQTALDAALSRGGDPGHIRTAFAAYYNRPASREDGGKYAMAAKRLLEQDRWRDFLPRVAPERPPDPRLADHRAKRFHETGEWRDEWGARPQQRTPPAPTLRHERPEA